MRLMIPLLAAALASSCNAPPQPEPAPAAPVVATQPVASPTEGSAQSAGSGELTADALQQGFVVSSPGLDPATVDPNRAIAPAQITEHFDNPNGPQGMRGSDNPARNRTSPPARTLANSNWWQAAPGAMFRSVHFLDNVMAATTNEGQIIVMPVDYSAQYVECGGYPTCVLATQPDGSPMLFFFARLDGLLVSVICNSALGRTEDEWTSLAEQVRASAGSQVVYDEYPAICWNANAVPFREVSHTWTLRDEEQYQALEGSSP
jgi:hypothetical protein